MLKDKTTVIGIGLAGQTVGMDFQIRNYTSYLMNGSTQDNQTLTGAKNVMVLEGYDGLAGDRSLALEALKKNAPILKKLSEIENQIVICIASGGGSTGSGTIPYICDIVSKPSNIVVAILLMPRPDAKKGISIDSLWGEMSNLFPEHFSQNITNQADQIIHVFDLVKKARQDMTQSMNFSELSANQKFDVTKNDKIRVIPLTDDMARVLRKVKEFEFKNGWLGEYVFQDDRGRVYASRISDCAVNNTTTSEFHNKKSIHAIRRTLNSNMKCAGVSGTVAASLLGHTEKVNEENYTYDVSSMEEKSKFMECAGRV